MRSKHTARKIAIGFDATWLVHPEKSGIGYYLEGLLVALAQKYSDEITFVGYYHKSRNNLKPPQISGLSYSRTNLPLKAVNALRRVGIEIPIELLLKRRSDFVLFPSFISSTSLFRTPSAVIVYDLAFYDMPDTVSSRNQSDLMRFTPKAIRRSKFIITISDWTKTRIEQVYNPNKPIVITHIPPRLSLASVGRKSDLEILGIVTNYLLFVGTAEPRKNILGMLEAYEKLPPEVQQKYAFVLAGGRGWDSQKVFAKITELKDKGLQIIVLGYVDEATKKTLLSSATALVLASFYEGFGMPLLEAQAEGTAVVASDLPVFREVCGESVLYTDPYDPTDISIKLHEVLVNPRVRTHLERSGKQNISRFSWDDVATTVYKEIISTTKKGAA